MDTVSHLIVERLAPPAGLDRMLGWSAVAHVTLLATIALVPAGWLGARPVKERAAPMIVELAAAVGPRDGGLTTMPARPVQHARDAEIKRTIEEVVHPPVAAEPEMVVPVKKVSKKQEAPVTTTAKVPAVADPKSESTGSGLASGGGGAGARLDISDFCCPEYIVAMQELINRNWSSKQQVAGVTVMQFTIQRDGRLTDIARERPSGQPMLDFQSERALFLTKQLPPLPAAYTQPALTVHMSFEYRRE